VDSQTLLAIGVAGVILALLALLVAVIAIRNLRRLRADYAALVSGSDVLSAEQRFAQVLERVAEQGASSQVTGTRLSALEAAAPGALSRMGLINSRRLRMLVVAKALRWRCLMPWGAASSSPRCMHELAHAST